MAVDLGQHYEVIAGVRSTAIRSRIHGGAVCLAAPKMPQGVPPPAWSTVGVIDV